MADMTVQRPSPESETRPANVVKSGSIESEAAVRSKSHEAITLPRRQTSAMSARFRSYGSARDRATAWFRHRPPLLLAGVGVAQDVEAFRVGGHHAVLDAVVDHLDEVARAARTAVQIALFSRAT